MKYQKIVKAQFLSRPNRFIAEVLLNGNREVVHVKNTGRCKELLVPGATVFLSDELNPNRKTRYDLVAVNKILPTGEEMLINMDSQAPNIVANEFFLNGNLFSKNCKISREVCFENSRFDFAVIENEKKTFIEVKGVTLEKDKIALFPDAPTERGVKHIKELMKAKKEGFGAMIFFVIQFKGAKCFTPNDQTHPEFGKALREAKEAGVSIKAYDCTVLSDSFWISDPVNIVL